MLRLEVLIRMIRVGMDGLLLMVLMVLMLLLLMLICGDGAATVDAAAQPGVGMRGRG